MAASRHARPALRRRLPRARCVVLAVLAAMHGAPQSGRAEALFLPEMQVIAEMSPWTFAAERSHGPDRAFARARRDDVAPGFEPMTGGVGFRLTPASSLDAPREGDGRTLGGGTAIGSAAGWRLFAAAAPGPALAIDPAPGRPALRGGIAVSLPIEDDGLGAISLALTPGPPEAFGRSYAMSLTWRARRADGKAEAAASLTAIAGDMQEPGRDPGLRAVLGLRF